MSLKVATMEPPHIPWGRIAATIWIVLMMLFIVRLAWRMYCGGKAKHTLAELKQKYRNDGCPPNFYIANDWFAWLCHDALIQDPSIKLFEDDQGVWIPFEHSRLRPESTRPKGYG